MKITSRDNSLLRRARAVRDGKIKESIFVEGLRLCEEALVSGLKIEAQIYSDEIASKERPAGVITSVTTSDPFGPKALRGAMGSSFRLSIWTNVEYPDMLAWCRQRGIKMLCADVNASAAYFDADWKG